tara:strand:- start:738 stop:1094 length:357 start_codon:yes stop_codon:yes gene_type:complete
MNDYWDLWDFDMPIPKPSKKQLALQKLIEENQNLIRMIEGILQAKKEATEEEIIHLNSIKEHYLIMQEWLNSNERKEYKSIIDKIRYRKKRIQIINNELSWLDLCFQADLNPKTAKSL